MKVLERKEKQKQLLVSLIIDGWPEEDDGRQNPEALAKLLMEGLKADSVDSTYDQSYDRWRMSVFVEKWVTVSI